MSFSDKLAALGAPGQRRSSGTSLAREQRPDERPAPRDDGAGMPPPAPPGAGPAALSSAGKAHGLAEAATVELSRLVPAAPTAHGPLHRLTRRLEGRLRWCGASVAALALDEAWREVDGARLLFLDTETTGLAGGTGTLAFLVGVATSDGQALQLDQLHLPRPGHERPMLHWLSERVAAASAIVTFNGKSFDWPLLRNRWVLNRVPPPPHRPHLDLLHCARRVFRHQLETARLGTLEVAALGHQREGDIDGADIPAAWFDFLRTGRVAALGRVLEHNARDVLTMVELLGHLVELWRGERCAPPGVALGLAGLAERQGDLERALAFVSVALASEGCHLRSRALQLEATLRRRQGDFAGAAAALEGALDHAQAPAVVHLALAKLCEHRLGDFERAAHHAQRASQAEGPAATERRRDRLIKRLERRTG